MFVTQFYTERLTALRVQVDIALQQIDSTLCPFQHVNSYRLLRTQYDVAHYHTGSLAHLKAPQQA